MVTDKPEEIRIGGLAIRFLVEGHASGGSVAERSTASTTFTRPTRRGSQSSPPASSGQTTSAKWLPS